MIVFPNAKINLGLNIINKRPDGYHNIESIFLPISVFDALEIVKSKRFEFSSSGIELDTKAENNLVVKAYNLMKKKFDIPTVKIHLHKKIPFGAGLGGGSADAAFTIKVLNELFKLQLTYNQLINIAKKICADCPFFIVNKPALVTGIGENITPVHKDFSDQQILLIKPDIHIKTAGIYKSITPRGNSQNLPVHLEKRQEWQKKFKNDFENFVFSQYPVLQEIKNKLIRNEALYASLTGTGSVVYGIFDKKTDLSHIKCQYQKIICKIL